MSKPRRGKFEWWKEEGAKEPFRFHLCAANGKIISPSEGYQTKRGCLNGIEAVKAVARDAPVVEIPASGRPK